MTQPDQSDPQTEEYESSDIAVVGMAGRFPGATDVEQYWQNLRDGVESVTRLTDSQLRRRGVPDSVLEDSNYVKAAALLDGVDRFDGRFFGFSDMESAMMDPQHRHFLECSWEALEHAGHDPGRFDGAIGVFGGSGFNAYMPYNLFTNPDYMARQGLFLVRHTGNDKDFLATRVSYLFDLKGPSVNVQTACSTSLVAMHLAVQSLLSHECDMALAGGVTIEMPHHRGYLYKDGEILSPDGHCRPFDHESQGTLFGSGAGVLVLRRLDDALAQGDTVYAVLKATAVNNDGAGKVSYLAPSVDGQAAAINEAMAIAGIEAESIDFVECHGTGTPIGDPIEMAALTTAYRRSTQRKQYCAVGSVKANIGHLDTAAGVASAIKVIQSLRHGELPPMVNFSAPNPAIDWDASPFYVNPKLKQWHAGDQPRRAAVSSLGVGGTNAHAIFEEAPPLPQTDEPARPWQLLVLSAQTEKALKCAGENLARHLESHPDQSLADVAYTLQQGRKPFRFRQVLAASSAAEAVELLDAQPRERVITQELPTNEKSVVFMFAGGGAQYPGMGRDLYDSEPVYRRAVDECLSHLASVVDFNLKALLYPEPDQQAAAQVELQRPSRSLTALFTAQYAQAKLWQSWGVAPQALIGHSMGENTAACIAGVLSLRDALGLVALRGQLFETVPEGGMLSVQAGVERLESLLSGDLGVACANAPELSVVSGPRDQLDEFETVLDEQSIEFQRIRINVAAHSAMLEPILEPFGDYLSSIELSAPHIPFVSNLTGEWITDAQATDPDYWVRHLRNTVRFADGLTTLIEDPDRCLLEVGPGKTLSSLALAHPSRSTEQPIVTSMRTAGEEENDVSVMLRALGGLWQAHAFDDWRALTGNERRRRVALPSYPFQRMRHWIEPGTEVFSQENATGLSRNSDPSRWFYQPVWRRASRHQPVAQFNPDASWLIVDTGSATCRGYVEHLASKTGIRPTVVESGDALARRPGGWRLPLSDADAWQKVLSSQFAESSQPLQVVVFVDAPDTGEALPEGQSRCFDTLFSLTQAIGNEDPESAIQIAVVTRGLHETGGHRPLDPAQALALGPVRVAGLELANTRCVNIDLGPHADDAQWEWLHREIRQLIGAPVVALRGGDRLLPEFEPVRSLDARPGMPLESGDTVLITGGIGGLALVVAEELASRCTLNLALVSRKALPAPEQWPELAQSAGPLAERFKRLVRLQELAQVAHFSADVSSAGDVARLADEVVERFGPVRAVVHTAGVIDDALIQLKDLPGAHRVLAPKVAGTVNLDRQFGGDQLRFLVAFSSISAFSGLPGQVDYAAANAFLDSYCASRDGSNGTLYTAINWPAWRQVGMAASIAAGHSAQLSAMGPALAHPLLGHCTERRDDFCEYIKILDVASCWVLDDHRLKGGQALIPGSGFMEMARAAYHEATGVEAVQISNVYFLAPLFVADGQARGVRISLHLESSGGRFTISSEQQGEWLEHCTGDVGPAQPLEVPAVSPETIVGRCTVGEQNFSDPDHHPHLNFGPRWGCLKRVQIGDREALLSLDMSEFPADLEHYKLHPAMLDLASAGAQIIIPGHRPTEEFYVPVGYQSLTYLGRTPEKLFSHVVYTEQAASEGHAGDDVTFDVTVCDEAGNPVIVIQNFNMRRIAGEMSAPAETEAEIDPGLKRTLELGLSPGEGGKAFVAALADLRLPQVAVSPFEIDDLVAELREAATGGGSGSRAAESGHDADADPDIAEIEAAFVRHEAVAEVVVRSHLDEENERRLVAHFVVDPDEFVTASELRRHLKSQLDPELVPHHLIELDELPLTAEGTPDRQALPDPYAPVDQYQAPETETQKGIARIWAEVLDISRVGVDENFFDLGGHSLLSIRAITRTNKKFGVQLNQAIMALQTLEQVAMEVDRQRGTESSEPGADTGTDSDDDPEKAAPGKGGLLKSLFRS